MFTYAHVAKAELAPQANLAMAACGVSWSDHLCTGKVRWELETTQHPRTPDCLHKAMNSESALGTDLPALRVDDYMWDHMHSFVCARASH